MCSCADQYREGSGTGKGLGVLITGFSSCRTKFVPNWKLHSAQVGMVPLKAEMEEMVVPCLHQPSPLARVSFTERLAYRSAQATIRQSVQTGTGSPQFKAALRKIQGALGTVPSGGYAALGDQPEPNRSQEPKAS